MKKLAALLILVATVATAQPVQTVKTSRLLFRCRDGVTEPLSVTGETKLIYDCGTHVLLQSSNGGAFGAFTGGGGGGGVSSVALALPGSVFSVSGSPVTSAGTLTGSFLTQTDHYVFAAATGGGTPLFRQLVAADVPTLAPLASPTFTGTVTAANLTVTGTCTGCGGGGGGAPTGFYDEQTLTTPPSSGWSWLNQESTTVTTLSSGSIYLRQVASDSTQEVRGYLRSKGSNTTWTMRMVQDLYPHAGTGNVKIGFLARNTTSGKVVVLAPQFAAFWPKFQVDRFDGPNTYNSTGESVETSIDFGVVQHYWLRLRLDSTYLYLDYSKNGLYWTQIVKEPLSSWISSVDQVGVLLYSSGTFTDPMFGVTVQSWTESP